MVHGIEQIIYQNGYCDHLGEGEDYKKLWVHCKCGYDGYPETKDGFLWCPCCNRHFNVDRGAAGVSVDKPENNQGWGGND